MRPSAAARTRPGRSAAAGRRRPTARTERTGSRTPSIPAATRRAARPPPAASRACRGTWPRRSRKRRSSGLEMEYGRLPTSREPAGHERGEVHGERVGVDDVDVGGRALRRRSTSAASSSTATTAPRRARERKRQRARARADLEEASVRLRIDRRAAAASTEAGRRKCWPSRRGTLSRLSARRRGDVFRGSRSRSVLRPAKDRALSAEGRGDALSAICWAVASPRPGTGRAAGVRGVTPSPGSPSSCFRASVPTGASPRPEWYPPTAFPSSP